MYESHSCRNTHGISLELSQETKLLLLRNRSLFVVSILYIYLRHSAAISTIIQSHIVTTFENKTQFVLYLISFLRVVRCYYTGTFAKLDKNLFC